MISFKFDVPFRASPHQTRCDGRDVNAVSRQLCPERVGQPDERELARAIRSEMRHRHSAANGGDVDDASSAAVAQMRKRLHHEIERRPEMQIHRALEILPAHVLERPDLDNPGIVDDDVEAAEMIYDILTAASICPRSSTYGFVSTSPAALHEFLTSLRQLGGIAREQSATRAPRAKLSRETRPSPRDPPVIKMTLPANEQVRESLARIRQPGEREPALA